MQIGLELRWAWNWTFKHQMVKSQIMKEVKAQELMRRQILSQKTSMDKMWARSVNLDLMEFCWDKSEN